MPAALSPVADAAASEAVEDAARPPEVDVESDDSVASASEPVEVLSAEDCVAVLEPVEREELALLLLEL